MYSLKNHHLHNIELAGVLYVPEGRGISISHTMQMSKTCGKKKTISLWETSFRTPRTNNWVCILKFIEDTSSGYNKLKLQYSGSHKPHSVVKSLVESLMLIFKISIDTFMALSKHKFVRNYLAIFVQQTGHRTNVFFWNFFIP